MVDPNRDLALAALDAASSLKLISQELGVITSNLNRLLAFFALAERGGHEGGDGASPELIGAARREQAAWQEQVDKNALQVLQKPAGPK